MFRFFRGVTTVGGVATEPTIDTAEGLRRNEGRTRGRGISI